MALQFDGTGRVEFPTWTETGDFDIHIPSFVYTDSTGTLLGDIGSGDSYIQCIGAGKVRLRVAGTQGDVGGLIDGQVYEGRFTRVGSTVTNEIVGVGTNVKSTTLPVTFDNFGVYNNYQTVYPGVINNIVIIQGDNNPTRTYDFIQSIGSTTLPDTTSGQDGTLVNFTTGGFIGGTEGVFIDTLDGFPKTHNFCKQRDANGDATITIAGSTTGTATTVEYQLDDGPWLVLDPAPSGGAFSGDVTINGQYDLTVRLSNDPIATDNVLRITSAACIVVWWQSNAAGRGDNLQPITVAEGNPVPIKHTLTDFEVLADAVGTDGGATGSQWPGIAQLYSDAGIPVCIGNVAVGGTSITQWQPATPNYLNIQAFHDACQGLEFSTSIGGETDTDNGMSTNDMITNLTTTLTAINNDFGVSHFLSYFPVGTNTGTPTNIANIRAAFDSVIAANSFVRFGGDLATIDLTGGDQLHLKTDSQLSQAVDILYPAYNSSTLMLSTAGVPDGSYHAVLWGESNNIVYNSTITVTSDAASILVNTPNIGEVIRGASYDNATPSSLGMWIQGVTV